MYLEGSLKSLGTNIITVPQTCLTAIFVWPVMPGAVFGGSFRSWISKFMEEVSGGIFNMEAIWRQLSGVD
jgi:hypothetical protein